MKTLSCWCCLAGGTMEIPAPLTESEVLPRVRANYLRPVLGWRLLLTVSSAQVLVASCLSYFILKEQLQKDTQNPPLSGKCATRWTLAHQMPQVDHANETQLPWQKSDGQVFTGNCTEYKGTSLEIKKSGVYYIFFQLMFKIDQNNVKFVMDFNGEKIIQYLEKNISSKTVYFGSTYSLRPGAKIFIISNPKKIKTGDSETFIGLFEL
ncbi:CD40 ligand-like isoform X2 [Hemitrygon akajei]|uniref:CD40 ligand-like isoform X2 n=1 Tax=Hemitrygon akajei TaxID=2704970 RepID=UPI003BF98D8D